MSSFMSPNTILWRYMSIDNFVDVIRNSQIYFCRIDLFDDDAEVTINEYTKRFASIMQNPAQMEAFLILKKQLEICRRNIFASCWCADKVQSKRMWMEYGYYNTGEGVAIQTKMERLTKSLYANNELTYIKINYVDRDNSYMDYFAPDYYELLSLKDKKYSFENEIRCLYLNDNIPLYSPDKENCSFIDTPDKRIAVKCNIDILIESILMPPTMPHEMFEDITGLIENKGLIQRVSIGEKY